MLGIRYNGYQDWSTDTVDTLAAGTSFVNLNDQPCDEVTIFIPLSEVKLDIIGAKQMAPSGSQTKFISVDAPSGVTIPVAGNAAEILVRRNDQSATPTTVRYIWRKFRR